MIKIKILKALFFVCAMLSYESHAGFCEIFFSKPVSQKSKTPKPIDINKILKQPLTQKQKDFLSGKDFLRIVRGDNISDRSILDVLENGFSAVDLEAILLESNPKHGPVLVKQLYEFMSAVNTLQTRLGQTTPMSVPQIALVKKINQKVHLIDSNSSYTNKNAWYESLREDLQELVEHSQSQKDFTDLVKGEHNQITLSDRGHSDWMNYLQNRKQAEKEMGKTLTHNQDRQIFWTQFNLRKKEYPGEKTLEEQPLFSVQAFIDSDFSTVDLKILVDHNILTIKEWQKTMIKMHIEDYETKKSL